MDDLRSLFPSIDGNDKARNDILALFEKLFTKIDDRKNEKVAKLAGNSERNYKDIITEAIIPKEGIELEGIVDELDQLAAGHPFQTKNYMLNAIPQASIASLLGVMTASLLNGNAIWDVISPAAAEAEVKSVAMLARIIGYDPEKAGGFFTYGGQGGVFNALRIGIEKAAPDSNEQGVPDNLYAFCSDRAHFSLKKAVETGIGSENIIQVKTNNDTTMDIDDLRIKMNQVLEQDGKISLVLATTGTTDTFAIDNVGAIKEMISDMVEKYDLDYIPHLHADGAMGGLYTIFNNYNFDENKLNFDFGVLQALNRIQKIMQTIEQADSVSIDFHKLGQAPYNNSVLVVKDNQDLNLVDLDKEDNPYLGEQGYGDYFTHYTAECSRMASGIAAYANLMSFGVEGYQKLLGHYVKLSIEFRKKLSQTTDYIKVMNKNNLGPITLFRVYNNEAEYQNEIKERAKVDEIKRINQLNEDFYNLLRDKRENILFGDTKQSISIRAVDTEVDYNLNATKAFMISPHTKIEDLDSIVEHLKESYYELINNNKSKKKLG
ncbi:pyridoxal-dependent decarboxylase [Halanaerocella petrolearia]